ncbi:hypothetical protein [Methanobrevibacter boviskoreani]|uniref:hypothetical protein n=1 Tax=Methanobrevibacter boviskoreani TaxID=1348249 RepID=UPI0023F556A1|nr:hypothetical protein [Methanobrevibacter boviskoreani]MDD6256584.1 hypothetical protein [Methanobrevibacter boviskoreani]
MDKNRKYIIGIIIVIIIIAVCGVVANYLTTGNIPFVKSDTQVEVTYGGSWFGGITNGTDYEEQFDGAGPYTFHVSPDDKKFGVEVFRMGTDTAEIKIKVIRNGITLKEVTSRGSSVNMVMNN